MFVSLFSITHAVAVAVDTSHVLERVHGELPIVLASTLSQTKIVAPWMDTVVTLSSAKPSTTKSSVRRMGSRGLPNIDSSHSHWTAEFRGTSGAGRVPSWSTAVDYSVLNHSPDGPCIEWRKNPKVKAGMSGRGER